MSSDRPRLVPAAYVVLRGGTDFESVLLQRRQGTGYMDGYWSVAAAGHAEFGESIVEAACRELAEELGVRAELKDMKPLCTVHRLQGLDPQVDHRVDFFFECADWNGEPALLEVEKADALEWFPLAALPEPMVPHEREVLSQLGTGGVRPILTMGF